MIYEDDDLLDDGTSEDEEESRKRNTWAILVNVKKGNWLITQVESDLQIGEVEIDISREDDIVVAAVFDPSVQSFLKAITELAGNSIEARERINDLLYGVCRSFKEAIANLEKWRSHQATKA